MPPPEPPGDARRLRVARPTRRAQNPAVSRSASDDPAQQSAGLPVATWLIAGSVTVALLAVAGGYGFHRDEMYFVLAGRHPDFGYVDQPPLTPLLSAAVTALLGLSPFAVRVVPAFAGGLVVIVAADMARRMGASRLGQALAALVLGISGWLGAGHLDETATFDIMFWTIALWLLIPALGREQSASGRPVLSQPWRWVAIGVVMGLALENKTLAIALPATVGASLVLVRRWDVFRSPWPWVAALLGLAIWTPNVVWQATHGFSQLTMAGHIVAEQGGLEGRLKAIAELLALSGPALFPVAIGGVVWLVRSSAAKPWRALGVAAGLQIGLMIVIGGKSYYSAGFLPLAIAAGSIPLSTWLKSGRRSLRRATFGVAAVASGAAAAVLLLPIVPVDHLYATPIPALYGESVAQVGWPELAAQVAVIVHGLPAEDRADAVIVTASYGQYSALTLLGHDLPPVISGHNSAFDWGRPADTARPVIVVGYGRQNADYYFEGCRSVATVDNGYDLPTEEQGTPIWICTGPKSPWRLSWPLMRHVN